MSHLIRHANEIKTYVTVGRKFSEDLFVVLPRHLRDDVIRRLCFGCDGRSSATGLGCGVSNQICRLSRKARSRVGVSQERSFASAKPKIYTLDAPRVATHSGGPAGSAARALIGGAAVTQPAAINMSRRRMFTPSPPLLPPLILDAPAKKRVARHCLRRCSRRPHWTYANRRPALYLRLLGSLTLLAETRGQAYWRLE